MRCSFFDLIGAHNRERVVDFVSWAMWAERGAAHDRATRGG